MKTNTKIRLIFLSKFGHLSFPIHTQQPALLNHTRIKTCFLWDMWSQPTPFFFSSVIHYLPFSSFIELTWLASVTVVDRMRARKSNAFPPAQKTRANLLPWLPATDFCDFCDFRIWIQYTICHNMRRISENIPKKVFWHKPYWPHH